MYTEVDHSQFVNEEKGEAEPQSKVEINWKLICKNQMNI